jgi:hypothetical protein
MSRGFGAMQRTMLKTMETAMRYELHNGALSTPYTTLSFWETKHPPGPFPITPVYRKLESGSWLKRCGVEQYTASRRSLRCPPLCSPVLPVEAQRSVLVHDVRGVDSRSGDRRTKRR